jgi:hypothetical protein
MTLIRKMIKLKKKYPKINPTQGNNIDKIRWIEKMCY